MSTPLLRCADDHVRTVVAMTAALWLPGLRNTGEGRSGTSWPGPVGHPRLPVEPLAPHRQERTP